MQNKNIESKYNIFNSLRIMCSVIFGLLIKDLKVKLGDSKVGLFWILAEPVITVAIFSTIWYITNRETIINIPIVMFIAMGVLPFMLFREFLSFVPKAIDSGKSLFDYRQVKPVDTVIARACLSVLLVLIATILLFIGLWWFGGFNVLPKHPIEVFYIFTLLTSISMGFALIIGTYGCLYQFVHKVIGVISRPLFFMSGIFYSISQLPSQAKEALKWNPILQIIEFFRVYFFDIPKDPVLHLDYLSLFALSILCLGLIVYYANRHRIIQR